MHFTAAYHASYHKHADDFSVWVYYAGDLLTEAGPSGYDYELPMTQHGYSSAAHNTLLVDGEGLTRVDDLFDATYLSSFELGESASWASGVNVRFDGVTHERNVALDRTKIQIEVIDSFSSENAHS